MYEKVRRTKREYIGCLRRKPVFFLASAAVIFASYFGLPMAFKATYRSHPAPPAAGAPEAVLPPAAAAVPQAVHLATPEPLKAVYMTACVAGTAPFREDVVRLIEETELNSVVIDLKDFSGFLSFLPENAALAESVSPRCSVSDMREFVRALHDKNIYVIGRITVFQDPVLAKRRPELAVKKRSDGSVWKDYKGLSFTDPGAVEVWDYHIAIAKEAYALGFDELNFDYIRFPSDGPMQDIAFSHGAGEAKTDVLERFFRYLSRALRPTGAVLSADLFGMTTTNTDDLNIGQVLEKAAPYFDYIAPMVYPSHYPPRFMGFDDPNKYPYEVVRYSLDEAVKRFRATTTPVALRGVLPLSTTTEPILYPKEPWDVRKLRPWLQDFDYGGNYDVAEVKAQMQAVYDAGLTSWMLWSPSNRYTFGALLSD